MKLDCNVLRYLSRDDFRVLTSVEMGQKNHELVPMPLIDSISGLKHGGAFRCVRTLLKHKLLHHENKKYDGYRLTYQGYDFLAIRALTQRGHITGVGRQIGVGKESDIYEVMNAEGEVFVLKLHRLGRTSFRAVKNTRDYLGHRSSFSWLYLSRLAALKEYAFMKALGEHGFPVPQAIDHNRHAVLMTLLDAQPLVQIRKLQHPAQVYLTCMEFISRLAGKGLIHCDFNEFNLMINGDEELTIIDFPQMVSVRHANAKEYFERDVDCIVRFFSKKLGYWAERDTALPYVRPNFEESVAAVDESLDVALAASGFQRQHQEELDQYLATADQEDEEEEEEEEEEEQGEGSEGSGAEKEKNVTEQGGTCAVPEPGGERRKHVLSASAGTLRPAADAEGSARSGAAVGSKQGQAFGAVSSGDEESAEEDGSQGEEDEVAEVEESVSGRQSKQSSRHTTKIFTPVGEREVQAAVVEQRKKALKAAALVHASRRGNTSKQVKGKGTKSSKAAAGSGGDFGGW